MLSERKKRQPFDQSFPFVIAGLDPAMHVLTKKMRRLAKNDGAAAQPRG
jgi:hypothetical protein